MMQYVISPLCTQCTMCTQCALKAHLCIQWTQGLPQNAFCVLLMDTSSKELAERGYERAPKSHLHFWGATLVSAVEAHPVCTMCMQCAQCHSAHDVQSLHSVHKLSKMYQMYKTCTELIKTMYFVLNCTNIWANHYNKPILAWFRSLHGPGDTQTKGR